MYLIQLRSFLNAFSKAHPVKAFANLLVPCGHIPQLFHPRLALLQLSRFEAHIKVERVVTKASRMRAFKLSSDPMPLSGLASWLANARIEIVYDGGYRSVDVTIYPWRRAFVILLRERPEWQFGFAY